MRLITRSDFDGLACAVLLIELGMVDEIKFAHPKDIQDGLLPVTENDVITNLPYAEGCGLWFDHHSSEAERGSLHREFKGASRAAPSAARVIFDYYGGPSRFGDRFAAMLEATDKADSAQYTRDEVLHPKGWTLLSFIMDPRTGLGRFHDYRISNYQLMMQLPGYLRTMTADEILALPDVQERVNRYFEQQEKFEQLVGERSLVDGNVLVTDLRGNDPIPTGNRFIPYALYPEQNISLWIVDGRNQQNCVIAAGHSIFNRSAKTDVGSLMLKLGGGGHRVAGTCQVPYGDADRVIGELIARMKADG
jgi:nanoRNase/pAp phosphatase (c-di-AMP/oligoRNAs hydrolase)